MLPSKSLAAPRRPPTVHGNEWEGRKKERKTVFPLPVLPASVCWAGGNTQQHCYSKQVNSQTTDRWLHRQRDSLLPTVPTLHQQETNHTKLPLQHALLHLSSDQTNAMRRVIPSGNGPKGKHDGNTACRAASQSQVQDLSPVCHHEKESSPRADSRRCPSAFCAVLGLCAR